MEYDFDTAIALLERTPGAISALLDGLPTQWTSVNEGSGTWSVHEVVAHLIHAEADDWLPRVRHILDVGDRAPFPPFNRTQGMAEARALPLQRLTAEFADRRRASLTALRALRLTTADLDRPGLHPEFGAVTLGQHLATWVAHDLTHLSQIARVMAKRYGDEVGPWRAYLSILK